MPVPDTLRRLWRRLLPTAASPSRNRRALLAGIFGGAVGASASEAAAQATWQALGSGAVSASVTSGTIKAWCNYKGTSVKGVRASYNVSSVTDNGTGDQTMTLAVALTDANHSPSSGYQYAQATNSACIAVTYGNAGAFSASAVRGRSYNPVSAVTENGETVAMQVIR